ncbi:MAG: bifunctional metallophosphatase/5'-nucleotidase [Firmicutes bacterium]|nr:bifunctional metallophosphatase/5'-nucleotidase [Bacillota bacterium]
MKKVFAKILILCMVLTTLIPSAAVAKTTGGEERINFVVSHDMHSHLETFPKVATVIKSEKKAHEETFILDGGDFSMGTPYQTVYRSEASELRMMGKVGFDVTTLGNHEFDYRSRGLSDMLNAAVKSKDKLPELVIANIDWDATLADESLKEDGERLKAALEEYGASRYTVVKRGEARIAVFGIFGREADSFAPESGTKFLDPVEAARDVVEEIKAHEKVDMIVCVSHSGTTDDPETSEDEILAAEVDGIDLIVSGHTHTYLEAPIIVNDTVIASVGQYNDNLGLISFVKKDGSFQMDSYELKAIDGKVKKSLSPAEKVDSFKDAVNEKYFSDYGYEWDEVLAKNSVDFTKIEDFALEQGEDTLGNIIADSYIYGVKKAEGKDYVPVDVAVAPAGVIRESFDKGPITVEEAFNVLSLGTGVDGVAGYPLVSVYLTGEELKLAAEVDISVSPLMSPARLYMSGLQYKYNERRMILNKTYDVQLVTPSGEVKEIEDDQLYRVVADLYSAQMLGMVNSMSYGLLSLVPKDADGNVINDYEAHIIHRKDGSELKEWYALASYIDSFANNKVPVKKYGDVDGRKMQENSLNPFKILKQTNKFFWMILAAVVLVLAVIALIVVLIVKLVRRMRYGKYGIRRKDMIFRR